MTYFTEIRNAAYFGNMTLLPELQRYLCLSNEQAAEICGVSLATFCRWKREQKPSLAAMKLLAILTGYVPWEGWKDWEMDNGYLFPPGYVKNGISPGDWFAAFFLRQNVKELERQAGFMREEIRELRAQIQELQRDRPAAPVLTIIKSGSSL